MHVKVIVDGEEYIGYMRYGYVGEYYLAPDMDGIDDSYVSVLQFDSDFPVLVLEFPEE